MLPLELRQNTASMEPIFIGETGDAMTLSDAMPSENLAISPSGEQLPFDVTGKTINELKKLGFTTVG